MGNHYVIAKLGMLLFYYWCLGACKENGHLSEPIQNYDDGIDTLQVRIFIIKSKERNLHGSSKTNDGGNNPYEWCEGILESQYTSQVWI